MAVKVFTIFHQVGDRTYLAPEFVGSYLDCRHWLADRHADMRRTKGEWASLILISRGADHYGQLSGWNAAEQKLHLWLVRPAQ